MTHPSLLPQDPLSPDLLPDGVRSRFVEGINGLRMHVLEAGWEGASDKPCLLLLHGFPELAYSWRKVMPALAAAGHHVLAPDQRGYGRTTGWDADYDGPLTPFRPLNLLRDILGLLASQGRRHVEAVIGHDFGSPIAATCALVRPDVFRALAMMSSPFPGPPKTPFEAPADRGDVHADLAALDRPRKHYQWYYATRPANTDMTECPQGLHAFLRAYYHHKSADWTQNKPFRLDGWNAAALAQMPTYYIMDLDETMAQTVAKEMPSDAEIAANRWLPEREMAVYAGEYGRTGFQGGLQWYRCNTTGAFLAEQEVFSGRTIDVPATFIAGAQDWGIYQFPGAIEAMASDAVCPDWRGTHLIEGAGHWVQQEQPDAVVEKVLGFLRGL
jgi:pimeloyl-ACP methyl ester carboxylesterase